jgi:hypothetical protein
VTFIGLEGSNPSPGALNISSKSRRFSGHNNLGWLKKLLRALYIINHDG